MTQRHRVHRYGDRGLLVEFDDPAAVLPFRAAVLDQHHPAVESVVPAACTVLIEFDPRQPRSGELTTLAGEWAVLARAGGRAAAVSSPAITLDVHYDGDDLHSVADEVGRSVDEVVRRHRDGDYTVQFCGFAPGFGYLTGLDPLLWLPRLASPRSSVPAGSVAIAGEYAGVYPRSSPGGWRLLGHTPARLFDPDRDPPALLAPGTRVRFAAR